MPLLQEILKSRFGYDAFRPKQESICRAVAEGCDALVVMPTGAGKSLCYQIPGLARRGTTLVISPLVALIEDQVHRLKERGIRAERIHSGRTREESRDAFRLYLKQDLEFLFIAPERLAVPGFSEMLKKHPPSLIAIDEAHCISQWGHDFRPDYRLVGERLEGLKTPLIALTATATEQVQEDICKQLRLRDPKLFIYGFRRDNLAIRAVEANPSEREAYILETLKRKDRLPAIIYTLTRKKAEELATLLKRHFRSEAYHAGLPAAEREKVQQLFLNDELDVIVATVAFGMGIDKANIRTVIHAALPGTVEGYYQEIGRAGRDGKRSEALLLYSYADMKTHEYFVEQDQDEALKKRRTKQLERIQMYAEGHKCRMLTLIKHFGDATDSSIACGICDRCTSFESTRVLDEIERGVAVQVLASLNTRDGQAMGRLFEEASTEDRRVTRPGFERVLSALNKARLLDLSQEKFELEGRTIAYRKVNLLAKGRKAKGADVAAIEIDGPQMGKAVAVKARKPRARKKRDSLKSSYSPR